MAGNKYLSDDIMKRAEYMTKRFVGSARSKPPVKNALNIVADQLPQPFWRIRKGPETNGNIEWIWEIGDDMTCVIWPLRSGRWVGHLHTRGSARTNDHHIKVFNTSGECKQELEAFFLWRESDASVAGKL